MLFNFFHKKKQNNKSAFIEKYSSELKCYIDAHYMAEEMPLVSPMMCASLSMAKPSMAELSAAAPELGSPKHAAPIHSPAGKLKSLRSCEKAICAEELCDEVYEDQFEEFESKISERVKHIQDGFSEYLLYLIEARGMTNSEVYKRAAVDKKLFSKIKNNPDYHPTKMVAMCLCVGAKLNLDDTRDLLARAGYALSPSDLTDIIFSFFIEQEHFDVIDIDIMLEEYGQPCIIE